MLLDLWPAARQHPPDLGASPGSPTDAAMPPVENYQLRSRVFIDLTSRSGIAPDLTVTVPLTVGHTAHVDHVQVVTRTVPDVHTRSTVTPTHTPASLRRLATDDEELALLARYL